MKSETKHTKNGYSPYKTASGITLYRSGITFKGKHISLGSYSSKESAAQAFSEANLLLRNPDSFPPFSHIRALPYEKYIILKNLHDNGLYFKTPIYLLKKSFEYHLDQNTIFVFDIDDMFFYSSHKIMKRGNHYFYADYGMQVNLYSKYGIKSYAKLNRDYRYRNDNPFDLRYENVEIINPYIGVTKETGPNGEYYLSKIHIKGNYIIGKYDTLTEAAIAYNKAVDILKKRGINKNYGTNYIEDLSPLTYAEIYSNLHISSKIINYRKE